MIAALLPVKTFSRSKDRLAGFLSPSERALLARTMFEDVWEALHEAQAAGGGLDRLLVVSSEPYVIARCRKFGIYCLEEEDQLSHSDSVNLATDWGMALGVTSVLSLPIDTPGVTSAEILELLDLRHRFPVVIVPSADGLGTNALLRTPPDAIQPHFGPGSCRLHAQESEENELSYLVFPSHGLANDIDTPDDLHNFVLMQRPCRTMTLAMQLLAVDRGAAICP
jgi:2-phospho-L-lactate guanylyltransferase